MKSLLIKFLAASVIVFGSINFVVAETTMRISLQLPLKSHLGQNLLLLGILFNLKYQNCLNKFSSLNGSTCRI